MLKMAPSKYVCVKCDKLIKENSGSLSCFVCKKWYHKKCSGLDNNNFNKLALEFKKHGIVKWHCSSCDLEVSVVETEVVESDEVDSEDEDPPSMKAIMEGMEALLLKHLEPFKQELKDIKSNMKIMKENFKMLKDSNIDVKKACDNNSKILDDLGERVKKLEKNRPDVNELFRESEDRKRREMCVIGFNIPESTKDTGIERQAEDKLKLLRLFHDDAGIELDDIRINRIGKASEGKTRPVKINLSSKEKARQVLTAKLKDETVRFKPDRTYMQREKLKMIKSELRKREEDGEKDLVIRYKFGDPVIETKEHFRHARQSTRVN